jgi:hypothetical protein
MSETTPNSTPSRADPVASLRFTTLRPQLDAGLVRDCSRLLLLSEERDRLHRRSQAGFMKLVRATWDERNALEAKIAATPARTDIGRRAKAEMALYILTGTGTIAQIPRSMIQDFLGVAGEGGA